MNTRLVPPKSPDVRLFAATNTNDAVKEYLSRVGRYVPGEILAAYLAVLPVIVGTTKDGDELRSWLYFVLFAGCLILTPVYFSFLATPRQPKKTQMLVSSIAFVVWAYSIGGWFTDIGWYHEAVAAMAVTFFSLISGVVAPTSSEP